MRFFNDICRSSLKISDNIKRFIAYKYINVRNEHVCINALVMLFNKFYSRSNGNTTSRVTSFTTLTPQP